MVRIIQQSKPVKHDKRLDGKKIIAYPVAPCRAVKPRLGTYYYRGGVFFGLKDAETRMLLDLYRKEWTIEEIIERVE